MNNHQFRTDINGLRAYAVVFVVLFHFNVFGFSAGYLGVDVFFVISGYLMTKIIVEKLEHNNFSFVDFYLSRIIRIYPALLFLVLVLTALGLFVFIPEDLKNFAKDARYSLLSYQIISSMNNQETILRLVHMIKHYCIPGL